ncbi:SET domain-containing protein, partial [Hymenopellis radicata]
THCFLLRPLKAFIMNTPGFPTAPVNPSIASHRVRASPLGGMGMFATRCISQGDLVLSERALIIAPAAMPCTYTTDGLSADDQKRVILHSAEQHLQILVDRMDTDEKNAYMSLSNDHKLDGSGPLLGVMRTNGYGIDHLREEGEGNAGAYSGVFAQMSRINHSCAPNTTRLFHMPSFSMRLYATRDIRQGEEMTASYDSIWKSTALRQKQLAPYDFRCSCPCCSNAEVSDRRRARIEDAYKPSSVMKRFSLMLHMKRCPQTNDTLMKDIEEGLRLFTEEGLEGSSYYPTFLFYVCAVLNALGTDGVRFRKYGIALLKSWITFGFNLGSW